MPAAPPATAATKVELLLLWDEETSLVCAFAPAGLSLFERLPDCEGEFVVLSELLLAADVVVVLLVCGVECEVAVVVVESMSEGVTCVGGGLAPAMGVSSNLCQCQLREEPGYAKERTYRSHNQN